MEFMAHGCPCIIYTYWHYLWNIELLTYLWYCQKIAQGQALLNQDMANYTNLASNFGVCVEFTSITRCVSMGYLYIYNQICIKLVNFTLKISAEFKKKGKKRNWNLIEFYIKSDIFHPFVQVLAHGLVQAQGIMEIKCPLKISLQLLQDETPTWCTIFLPPWICFVMTVILYLKKMPEWC